MEKRENNIDFKDLIKPADKKLANEIGIDNNEIGEKINDRGDLATRIAGGFVNGQITKNLGKWNKKS